MSTNLVTIARDNLKARWNEPYVSEALNMHTAAFPAGIVYGFSISVPSGKNIRFSLHSELALSLCRIRVNNVCVTYRESSDITINLAAHAGTTVYLGITGSYSTGSETTGAYIAYSEAEYNAGVLGTVWLCKASVPGSGAMSITDIDTSIRSRSWSEVTETSELVAWKEVIADPALVSVDSVGLEESTGDATSDVTDTNKVNGVHLVKLYLDGGTAGDVNRLLNGIGMTKIGTKIRLRYRIRTIGFTSTGAGVYLRYRDKDFSVLSDEVVGLSYSTSTVAMTTYTYEVSPPANTCYVEVGVGAKSISAGNCWIETVQVWTEAATGYLRGNQMPQVWTPSIRLLSTDTAGKYACLDWTSDQDILLKSSGGANLSIGEGGVGDSENINVSIQGTLTVNAITKRWTIGGGSIKAYASQTVDYAGVSTILDEVVSIDWSQLSVINNPFWSIQKVFYIPIDIAPCTLKKLRVYGSFDCTGSAVPADIETNVNLYTLTKHPSLPLGNGFNLIGIVELSGSNGISLKCETDLGDTVYSPTEDEQLLMMTLTIGNGTVGGKVYIAAIEIEYEVMGI